MNYLTSCFFIFASSLAYAAKSPNVIVIMADDFGYECVTANGGESYKTPHLDRLAAGGVRFEQCHTPPLCTPTRVQLMTGCYNVRNYLCFGILPRTESTFGQLFQNAGYATGICGKWQLGQEIDSPQHFGFSESCLWQHTRRPPRFANPGLEYNGEAKDYHSGEYGPKLVNDWALDFISRHKDRPFFLYYPMILTHDPFQPTPDSPDWDPKAVGEKVNRHVRHFGEMVEYMDRMIGRLDAHLADLGIRENTLLLFLGDNGTHSSVTSRFKGQDYPGGKGRTTSRGHHVPLIASWPAVIQESRVCEDLVSTADLLPTICEAASIPVPDDKDGQSFFAQLRGETGTPRDALYIWYSSRQRPDLTVREFTFDKDYKLYRTGEFFDLRHDPDEKTPLTNPLSSDQSAARMKLQALLEKYRSSRPEGLDRQFQDRISKDTGARKGAKK